MYGRNLRFKEFNGFKGFNGFNGFKELKVNISTSGNRSGTGNVDASSAETMSKFRF